MSKNYLKDYHNKEFILLNENAFELLKHTNKVFKTCLFSYTDLKPNLSGIKFPAEVALTWQSRFNFSAVHSKMLEISLNKTTYNLVIGMDVIRRSVPGLVSAKIENENLIIFKEDKVIYDSKVLHESDLKFRSYIYSIATQKTDIPPIFSRVESIPRTPVANPIIDFSIKDLIVNPDQEKWNNLISLIIMERSRKISTMEAIERGLPAVLCETFVNCLKEFLDMQSFAAQDSIKDTEELLNEYFEHGSKSSNFEAFYDREKFWSQKFDQGFPLEEKMNELRMKEILKDESRITRKRSSI